MDWKKCGKALLFPHPAIMILLLPVATLGLIGALMYLDSDSVAAILAYLLAFYTLLVWCMRFPGWWDGSAGFGRKTDFYGAGRRMAGFACRFPFTGVLFATPGMPCSIWAWESGTDPSGSDPLLPTTSFWRGCASFWCVTSPAGDCGRNYGSIGPAGSSFWG